MFFLFDPLTIVAFSTRQIVFHLGTEQVLCKPYTYFMFSCSFLPFKKISMSDTPMLKTPLKLLIHDRLHLSQVYFLIHSSAPPKIDGILQQVRRRLWHRLLLLLLDKGRPHPSKYPV